MSANGNVKKDTEFNITSGFCQNCNRRRFFYQHKDGGDVFCQVCHWSNDFLRYQNGTMEKV